jgi:hypothetical protein
MLAFPAPGPSFAITTPPAGGVDSDNRGIDFLAPAQDLFGIDSFEFIQIAAIAQGNGMEAFPYPAYVDADENRSVDIIRHIQESA